MGEAIPLHPRSALVLGLATLVGLLAFGWPLLVGPGAALDDATAAPLVLGVVLLGVLAAVLVAFGEDGLDVRAVAMLGLLAAVGAVVRPLSAGAAGIETVFVLVILGGRVFGAGFGFVLGATTLFASALLTGGVGPWLPFQMVAASWVGLGAGLLPRLHRRGSWREIAVLCGYGAVAALVFGVAMNLSFWPFVLGVGSDLSYLPGGPLGENLRRFVTFTVVTSLGWDIGRAITTVVGIAVVGRVVLPLLRRTATRARFTPA
ncbi:ECF transporter S component [Pseudactinotalea suaedae]|uniref:ECF transporter S component n=1 Tax=Pseudactinotalea suaedae TaxID=1524924 RepID=UPI0012E2FD7B|nr:ECF transporter S component [Pseudactinotalea suaedae]